VTLRGYPTEVQEQQVEGEVEPRNVILTTDHNRVRCEEYLLESPHALKPWCVKEGIDAFKRGAC